MRPLARLPVFFGLEGRIAVVAGASEAAAWKAELLAACGAQVRVYARDPSKRMRELLESEVAGGEVIHLPRKLAGADLIGTSLAVCDADDDAEAAWFHDCGLAAGVPINVIDRPAFCDFQFGTVVNRSPVVIGVSTDGAAPVLGQAIRRHIETLIPASLAIWTAAAKILRQDVMDRLGAPARRRFWDRFAELAMRCDVGSVVEGKKRLASLAEEVGRGVRPAGHVMLVGAGPGDTELLTIKAVRALQSADVVLFDELVCDDVLELARREARRIPVGPRGRRASSREEDINWTMISLARAGRRVVRLKLGDPMTLGCSSAEIAALETADIGFEVVPGIAPRVPLEEPAFAERGMIAERARA